ncbi:MAG: hypothetical protein J4F28_09370 [Nitrosopumilaceae archaeon]|nr:hypothetical protein [Nitrosopumilaceae archaeon]
MPLTSSCSDCHGQNIHDTEEPCPKCGTQVMVQKCDDCGHADRSTVPSECNCWTSY